MWRCACGMFLQWGPNELSWIEFWSTGWKPIDMDAWFILKKLFNQFTLMDGMMIPNENNFTWDLPQQLLQKCHNLHTGQRASVRADAQLETFFAMIRNKDSTQQIQSLMVIQTGAHHRRVPTGRPSPFQWRNERKAAFIFKNQCSFQLTPLFLSVAKCISSSAESPHHRVGALGVADVDCSNQFVS